MKKQMKSLVVAFTLLLAGGGDVLAATMNFDGTAPAGSYHNYDYNGTYTEAGLTITATGNTVLYAMDPTFNANYPSSNSTDFGYFDNGTQTVVLSAASPFSLQRFNAANIVNFPSGTLTLTGNLFGGGTVSQQFTTSGGNAWSLFTLNSNFTNLTSVTIVSSQNAVGIDNITFNEPVSTPIPAAAWLFGSGLVGLLRFRKKAVVAESLMA